MILSSWCAPIRASVIYAYMPLKVLQTRYASLFTLNYG